MTLALVYSRAELGIEAPAVTVEVHLAGGLPRLTVVGLPEAAVRESKDRVRGALINSHLEFPAARLTINLAPADLPKDSGRFDLPIALGILAASGQVPPDALARYELVGELALSGELRPVCGVMPLALRAREAGRALIVPSANADEAALVEGAEVYGASHLLGICGHLIGQAPLARHAPPPAGRPPGEPDLADVRGQPRAKRALTVAAAGGHSLLLIGPPGTGKSMLAARLPGILPPLDPDEALETAAVASVSAQGFDPASWRRRPFRAPHHTASGVALVGGGSHPRPGEISLAHHGVLFLDELPEYDRRVLEVLREPLESGRITISRAACQADFPARFQLVAAMNPCPCGHLGEANGRCRCTEDQVRRYRARVSGPVLDRIDLHVEVPRLAFEALRAPPEGERSDAVRERVIRARERAHARQGRLNAGLEPPQIETHCRLADEDAALLRHALERLQLSARAYHRILKVARSIADLDGAERIDTAHLTEAIGYRTLDRGS